MRDQRLHLARTLNDVGDIPGHGNQRSQWDAGCRFDFENPEYRPIHPGRARLDVGRRAEN